MTTSIDSSRTIFLAGRASGGGSGTDSRERREQQSDVRKCASTPPGSSLLAATTGSSSTNEVVVEEEEEEEEEIFFVSSATVAGEEKKMRKKIKKKKKKKWTPRDLQQRYRKLLEKKANQKNDVVTRQRHKESLRQMNAAKWELLLPSLPHSNEGGRNRMDKTMIKKIEILCLVGVPSQYRPTVWPVCIGNALSITKDLFEIFRDRARIARRAEEESTRQKNEMRRAEVFRKSRSSTPTEEEEEIRGSVSGSSEKSERSEAAAVVAGAVVAGAVAAQENKGGGSGGGGGGGGGGGRGGGRDGATVGRGSLNIVVPGGRLLGREETINRIKVDLPRTFPQLAFFSSGPLHQALRDVLEAYTFMRPDCGYVQGMSYLAAILLLFLDTYEAFEGLANIMAAGEFCVLFLKMMICFWSVLLNQIYLYYYRQSYIYIKLVLELLFSFFLQRRIVTSSII